MKHYLGILLIIDASPHINDTSINWIMDPNVIIMNKQIWNKYLTNQKDILCLFMQLDPNLKEEEYILDLENNIIKVQGYHSVTPGSMILTLKTMKFIKENFTFDYIIRATTSTFWVLPKLKNILVNLPKEKVFKGPIMFGSFISGSGMIFSNDVVNILINNMNFLIKLSIENNTPDDVLLGDTMPSLDVPMIDMKFCNITHENILTSEGIDKCIKETDIPDLCYYRVKSRDISSNDCINSRLEYDTIILNTLYKYYYEDTE
jgi:hypothetical protein